MSSDDEGVTEPVKAASGESKEGAVSEKVDVSSKIAHEEKLAAKRNSSATKVWDRYHRVVLWLAFFPIFQLSNFSIFHFSIYRIVFLSAFFRKLFF